MGSPGRASGGRWAPDRAVRPRLCGHDRRADHGAELAEPAAAAGERTTYLVVDGENIDATLGMSVLNRRPNPDERPRWERVREFAENQWGQPVKALFFLNATNGHVPMSFV